MKRFVRIAKASVLVGTNQVLIQAIGFGSGLIVIRLLPTEEYAVYTLGSTAVATALLLADSGVANGVMAEGGKVLRDARALADVVATGIGLRKRFAFWATLICTPALVWMLRRHGASWGSCGWVTAAAISAFLTSLTGVILEIPLRLRQELAQLQSIQLKAALLRMLAISCCVPLLRWAAVGLLANGAAQAWTNHRLRDSARQGPLGCGNEASKAALLRMVRLTLPGVIYYCVSGQLTIWLLSIFGSTTAVAQVGALARLAAVLAVVTSWFALVIAPRFARLENRRRLLFSHFGMALAGVGTFALSVSVAVWVFPNATLSVLGPRYHGLHTEAVLMTVSSCLGLLASTIGSLAAARGLLLRPVVAVPIGFCATATAVALCDISTAVGVLTMGVATSAFAALFSIVSGAWLIQRHSK